MLLVRLFRVSNGDILLQTYSLRTQFIVFVASWIANRSLHVVNTVGEFRHVKTTEKIGTIITDSRITLQPHFGHLHMQYVDAYMIINANLLLNNKKNFDFIKLKAINAIYHRDYFSLMNSSFKDERESMRVAILNYKGLQRNYILSVVNAGNTVKYFGYNIDHMLKAIDSEFGEDKNGYVSFIGTKFQETFVYFLYFFMRGYLSDITDTSSRIFAILAKNNKIKRIIKTFT